VLAPESLGDAQFANLETLAEVTLRRRCDHARLVQRIGEAIAGGAWQRFG
jgi:hypothetical protein